MYRWRNHAGTSTLPALRISRWGEGVEQRPVGSAGVEQGADPVVAEAAHPECHSLDAFDEVVDRFGGSVADLAAVPGDDLVAPAADGAAKAAHLEGHLGVGEVADDLVNPRLRHGRVG